MSKYNSLKIIVFLKSVQVFLYITIFAFLLTIFISSVNVTGEKIFLWNNPANINDIIIGFYKISLSNNNFILKASPLFIACNVIILSSIIIFIINSLILKIHYHFEKKQFFKSGLIFITLSILFLVVIYSIYFSKPINFIPNTNNQTLDLNYLIKYVTTTTGNLTIANYWFSTNGIVYLSILSPIFLVLVFFPIKIIYNLVRVSYI